MIRRPGPTGLNRIGFGRENSLLGGHLHVERGTDPYELKAGAVRMVEHPDEYESLMARSGDRAMLDAGMEALHVHAILAARREVLLKDLPAG